jgi:hypothetical protein
MTLDRRSGRWLLLAGLLCMARPARGAELDKYLIDDADALVTLHVRQAVSAPIYGKHVRLVEDLLKARPIQALLKDSGFDPLKDVERITVVHGRSCHPPEGEVKPDAPLLDGYPCLILHGNLDTAKLTALAASARKNLSAKIKEIKIDDSLVWELTRPVKTALVRPEGGDMFYYLAVPEKGTVVVSPVKEHIVEALQKARGARKTRLKVNGMSELVEQLDRKATLSWVASGDMISTRVARVTTADSEFDKKRPVKVEYTSLKVAAGIAALTGSLTAADDLKGQTTLTCTDASRAREIAGEIEGLLKKNIDVLTKLSEANKEQAARVARLLDVLKSVKVTTRDKAVTLTAQARTEALVPLIQHISAASSSK